MTNTAKLFILFGIAVCLLAFDYWNGESKTQSFATPGNGRIIGSMPIAMVSTNKIIQEAYERCRHKVISEFKMDNSHLPADIQKMTLDALPDLCKDQFEATCQTNDPLDKQCRFTLAPYLH